jgi:hypothetical protein
MVSDVPNKPPCEQWSNGGNFTDGGPNVNVPSIPAIQTIKTVCPTSYAARGEKLNGTSTKIRSHIAFIYILNAVKLP